MRGVILDVELRRTQPISIPRMRGGDPSPAELFSFLGKYSPHARGWSRGAARTKIRQLYKKKPTPAVKAQIEKLKVVSGDKAGKKDLTPWQYNANMQECKKHLLGRSYRPGKKVTSITDHSNLRSVARDIHPQKILDILRNAKNPYPGNIPHTTCYEKDSKKVAIDDAGHIVTVMHVYDRRPKKWKPLRSKKSKSK